MPQKPLAPEVFERARELRSEGQTILGIATELGISQGSASNATRGIGKPARATQSQKEPRYRAKDMLDTTIASKPDQETVDLANRVRRGRLQGELDELEDRRHQREDYEDLRRRARAAEVELSEARAKMGNGSSPEAAAQIASLRDDRDRLERELAELRHTEQLDELKRGMTAQLNLFQRELASRDRSGLSRYDILDRSMARAENLVTLGASKIDKAVSRFTTANDLKLALSLGLSPGELEVYFAGPVAMPDFVNWKVLRLGAARQSGEPEPSPEDLKTEYEGLSSLYQGRNAQYQAVALKIERTKAMAVAASSKRAPAVMPKDTVPVKCSSCGSQVLVDLADPVIARSKTGNCPGCGAMMDLTKLFPVEAEPKAVKYE